MPDHLHVIIAFPREPGLKTAVKNWKRYAAREYRVRWQRDFFDHRLRDHHQLEEKTAYILANPIRKGLVKRPEDWPWIYRASDWPAPFGGRATAPPRTGHDCRDGWQIT